MCNRASKRWGVVLSRAAVLLLFHSHLLSLTVLGEEGNPPVKCVLTLERASFLLGQPVRATIRITNQGDTPVLVLEPSLINKRAVVLTITRKDGSVAKYDGELVMGFRRPVVRLGSGKSVEEVVTISEYYDLAAPGEYKIRATCHLERAPNYQLPAIDSDLEIFRIQRANGRIQRRLSVDRVLSDGSPGGMVNWQVFTHKVGGVVRVYCRTFFERRMGDRVVARRYFCFVDIGAIRSEETVSCLADTTGNLHVLFEPLKEAEGLYAHATISRFGKLESMHLYRPAKGSKPSLTTGVATGVYIEGAQRVEPRGNSE